MKIKEINKQQQQQKQNKNRQKQTNKQAKIETHGKWFTGTIFIGSWNNGGSTESRLVYKVMVTVISWSHPKNAGGDEGASEYCLVGFANSMGGICFANIRVW